MEPIKVQSEGGLNVTLTIRLLMHGKVQAVGEAVGSETDRDTAPPLLIICQKQTRTLFHAPPAQNTPNTVLMCFCRRLGAS